MAGSYEKTILSDRLLVCQGVADLAGQCGDAAGNEWQRQDGEPGHAGSAGGSLAGGDAALPQNLCPCAGSQPQGDVIELVAKLFSKQA